MRTYLDCIPCLMNQALRAARLATGNEAQIKRILDEVGQMIREISMGSPPPVTARNVYRIVEKVSGNADPCRSLKKATPARHSTCTRP